MEPRRLIVEEGLELTDKDFQREEDDARQEILFLREKPLKEQG
jgi:hypothetical protein